jgi:hypothetical protein
MAGERRDVGQLRVERVVGRRAPARAAIAAGVECDELTPVGRQLSGDLDPVGGIVIAGAVQDQDRRLVGRGPEVAVGDLDVAVGDRAGAM